MGHTWCKVTPVSGTGIWNTEEYLEIFLGIPEIECIEILHIARTAALAV